MIIRTQQRGASTFHLRPNGSLGWRHAKWCCLAVMVLTAAICGWFVSLGAWMVLPFAGAEMLLVGGALYLSCRWSARSERIQICDDEVIVERGRHAAEECHRLQRAWAQVVLVRDPARWYPSRLLLRSHGRNIEVGDRLTEEERLDLAAELAPLTRALPSRHRAAAVLQAQPVPPTLAT